MSNDIKYFQDLLAEMKELQNIHKGVSITGRSVIAQTVEEQEEEVPSSKPTEDANYTKIVGVYGLEIGKWIWENVAPSFKTNDPIKENMGWVYVITHQAVAYVIKKVWPTAIEFGIWPLFKTFVIWLVKSGPSAAIKIAGYIKNIPTIVSSARTAATAVKAGATTAEAIAPVATTIIDVGIPAAEATALANTTVVATASGAAATTVAAYLSWALVAAAMGVGIGMIINHFAGNWIDEKIWKLFGSNDEKKSQQLSSQPAMWIAKLFQSNKALLSPAESLELVKKFTENYNYFKENAKTPEEKSEKHINLAALNAIAKTKGFNLLKELPKTLQDREFEQQIGDRFQNNKDKTTNESQSPNQATYTVVAGDTLSKIALKLQKDHPGITWQDIAAANQDLIKNVDQIQVGWKFKIPTTNLGSRQAPQGTSKSVQKKKEEVKSAPEIVTTQPVNQSATPDQSTIPTNEQQVPQKATSTLVEEFTKAPTEEKKDEVLQQLVSNMQAVARSGNIAAYWQHLSKFPIDEETADQHGYEILKQALTGNSGIRTLLSTYGQQIQNRSFKQLDKDYDTLGSISAVFLNANMEEEAKIVQKALKILDKARDNAK